MMHTYDAEGRIESPLSTNSQVLRTHIAKAMKGTDRIVYLQDTVRLFLA